MLNEIVVIVAQRRKVKTLRVHTSLYVWVYFNEDCEDETPCSYQSPQVASITSKWLTPLMHNTHAPTHT